MPFFRLGRDFPAMRTPLFTLLVVCASALQAQDYSWPREIPVSGGATGTIVLYQPQAEELTGNALTARGAIALRLAGRSDPIFGAMWMSATIDVDRDSGMVWVSDVRVTRVRWPDATEEQQRRFTQLVEMDFPKSGFRFTLARLQASLASADAERSHTDGLKSDAPKIVFTEQLAVLLLYDGEPHLQPIPNAPLALVVNTPFGVVKDTVTGTFWLGAGPGSWYSATDPKGPWTAGGTPPDAIRKLAGDTITVARVDTLFAPSTDTAATKPDTAAAPPRTDTLFAPPPTIVTATEPTELVATQGPPKWTTTAGGKLLYVENTETPWIRETEGKDNYLLISGRWFRSQSLLGPWSFARADSLPASFQEIPPDSPIGGVQNSVALTVEAQDAVLDLQIPQTTAVVRSQTTFTAKYDGEPKFVAIPGTLVAYATNTPSSVLHVGGAYYACDNAVWFKATSPQGPWIVADSIPRDEIAKIPPSVPVYPVTFVHVYGSTPEVVYVGYTPGYVGAYPYYGVPVYGTGYTYPPYVGTVYYPYPVTYGVSASYNPYTGYGMGTTFGTAFFAFGVGVAISNSYRYYPAGGYRGCFNCTVNVNRGNVNRGRQNVNIGNTAGGGARQRPANRPSASQRPANSNLYNRPETRARNADQATRQRASSQMGANRTARGSNNVFADRNGNVHRRTSGGGWESRQGNNWSRDRGGSSYGSQGGNREYQARQRSSTRSSGGSRGGGGRGGGGRRR